jgi:hypothetical protein
MRQQDFTETNNSLQTSRIKNKSIENLKKEVYPVSQTIFRPKTSEPKIPLFTHTFMLPQSTSSKSTSVKNKSIVNLKNSVKNKSIENLKNQDLFNVNIDFPKSKIILPRPTTAAPTTARKLSLFTHTLQIPKTISSLSSSLQRSPTKITSPLYKKTDIISNILENNEDPGYLLITRHPEEAIGEKINILFRIFTFYVLNGCHLNKKHHGYEYSNVLYKNNPKAQIKIRDTCKMLIDYNTILNDIYTLINTDTDVYKNVQLNNDKKVVTEIERQLKEKIQYFLIQHPEHKISSIIHSLQNFKHIDNNDNIETLILDGWIYLLNSTQKGGKRRITKKKVLSKKKKVLSKKKVVSKNKKVVSKKKKIVSKKKKVLSKKKKVVLKKKKIVSKKKKTN